LDVAYLCEVDLFDSFKDKMAINRTRKYKVRNGSLTHK
jgi:hypothetical protein